MRSLWIYLLVFLLIGLAAQSAHARPTQGDKTLNLGMTELRFSSGTRKECDHNGNNCRDTSDESTRRVALGGSAGYMASDMFELGATLRFGLGKSSSKPKGAFHESEASNWSWLGALYGKAHLGDNPTLVPFAAAGAGLGISKATREWTGYRGKTESASAIVELYIEGGVAYYLAENYGITASMTLARTGQAWDPDINDDEIGTMGYGETAVRFGLGLSTYF